MTKTILFICTVGILLGSVTAQYAVSSAHQDCGGQCSTNTTCCGSDSFCAGPIESHRCCPSNTGFCGCLSNRAYCSGSVYNQTGQTPGTDSFGTCYDTSAATCSYDPNPNIWIVCPKTYTACPSNSFYLCCSPDQECQTTSASAYAICGSKTSSTTKAASSSSTKATTPSHPLPPPSQPQPPSHHVTEKDTHAPPTKH
ncbi:hypothetical protein PROFUN_13340 [Planoprotostelium fungivorum]|uniref:Uncharacterized protein n=1 Tax=Planoprotostelium fungivorum TaxID=1890364 RepID=A0A2P6N4N6_9EUKA|nr:hypothetical protein PROFUN_13340 [Planoprotostelium fungivorum]